MRIKIGNIWRQSKLRSGCAEDLLKLVRNPMQKDVVFVFDHNLGGGANLYREKRINEMRCAGERILLVYYDLPTLEYYIRYLEGAIEETFKIGTLERVEEIARFIKLKEIFFNNAFSFDDPLAIAILLPSLKNKTGAHLTIAVHDYFMICPSYTLLDYRGRFCGIPNLIQCQHCLSNSKGDFTLFVDCRNITEWRNAWGICLHEADTILCFSRSSVNLLMRAYPDLDETKFEIRPHSVEYLPRRDVFLDYQTPLNIGVVGRIAEHKGAGIIREMVKIIEEKNLPVKITIFGELEGSFSSPVLRVTGTYQREELPELIERARANLFFLPSICPETFSYVTEELMLMGVPLAVFDLGAPAERVRNYSKGLIIKEINARHALDQLIAFYARLRRSMPKGGSK
ncbi:glycosyltransferase [Neomoorella thermoacetica]|nr:glycosyltransferase [Moorella thermoacetica]